MRAARHVRDVLFPSSWTTTRLHALDAARGVAMLFVLLSHFSRIYFATRPNLQLQAALSRIGLIASPTFVVISGSLLGFLYRSNAQSFTRIKTKLINRGLFLLTIGHLLICAALLPSTHTARWLLSTDALGVAMIVGTSLISRVGRAGRLTLGAVAYAVSWVVIACWSPTTIGAAVIKETFFGSLGLTVLPFAFPLLPWFGVYLAASVVGERLAVHHDTEDPLRTSREVAAVAAPMLALAVGVKIIELFIERLWGSLSPADGSVPGALMWVGQKYPPGPMYLLWYGGLGLALMASCLMAEARGWFRRTCHYAAAFGQASLFIFVLQFYVYYVGLAFFDRGSASAWWLYFGCTIVIIAAPALVWHRRGYNRFITVGYRSQPNDKNPTERREPESVRIEKRPASPQESYDSLLRPTA